MGFLFLLFTVLLSLCVVGLIVLALSSILGSVRDDWKLKKREREPRPGDQAGERLRQARRPRAEDRAARNVPRPSPTSKAT
jgi:hypothetical protein